MPLPAVPEGRAPAASTSYSQHGQRKPSFLGRFSRGQQHPAVLPIPSSSKQQQAGLAKGWRKSQQQRITAVRAVAASTKGETGSIPVGVGEVADVEELEGIRVLPGEENRAIIQYLVKWKDGAPPTWEPVENLADNLLRDFEEKWWRCCREGEEAVMRTLLSNSKNVLPFCVNTDDRSALHFAAALGKTNCCQMLCDAGAEVDYPDKDGYTPLHMAVGYSHVNTVKTLLEAGANPEIPDTQGRNVVQLVDSIRDSMPLNPQLAGKRIALEEVSALLTGNLFEELFPKRILECRSTASGKEYLIQWLDGAEDSWVKESDVANDVIEDFEKGYIYAEAESLRKMKMRGDQRLFLVRWLDGTPDSWETEDHVSPSLIAAFEQARDGSADSQQSLLPEPIEVGLPVSKRAKRRAKKLARRAASASGGSGGPYMHEGSSETARPHSNGGGQTLSNSNGAATNKNGNGHQDSEESGRILETA